MFYSAQPHLSDRCEAIAAKPSNNVCLGQKARQKYDMAEEEEQRGQKLG